jgi:hypothetical protein
MKTISIFAFGRIFLYLGTFFKNIVVGIWAQFFQKSHPNSPKQALDFGYFLSLNYQISSGKYSFSKAPFGRYFGKFWALSHCPFLTQPSNSKSVFSHFDKAKGR